LKNDWLIFINFCEEILGWPLWNICVTNDNWCVPLVANVSRSFPHSWFINGFVTRLARRGAGTAHPSGALEFTPGFYWGSCYPIFSFMCMFCRSLFVLLFFFFWPLCCLFFDLRILIGIFKLFLICTHISNMYVFLTAVK